MTSLTSFASGPFLRRTGTAVAAVALAALSLTACQDDELVGGGAQDSAGQGADETQEASSAGGAENDPAESDSEDTQETSSAGGAGDDRAESDSEGTDTGERETAEGGAGTTDEDTLPCTDSHTDLTVATVERPINHLLLTATNTGSETCFAWFGPYLRFGDAQAPAMLITESSPQAVTAIAPGESAYAAVLLSGDEAEGHTVTSLGVQFSGDDQSAVGDMENVPLPGGEAYVDGDLAVTYWLPTPGDALVW
jgi:hypothetical protein